MKSMDREVVRAECVFWLRKLFEVAATLLLVTLLSFLLMRLSTVDPAEAYVKRKSPFATAAQIEAARETLGLNRPLIVQYGEWLGKALRGDLGTSLYSGRPVIRELADTLPETAGVVAVYAALTVVGTLVFGVLNYLARNNGWRFVLKAFYFAAFSIPSFFLASVYMDVFAVRLGWVRVHGNEGFWKYFPPAFLLAIMSVGLFSQMLGKHLEGEMKQDYAFFALGRGLSERRVLLRHAMRHAVVKILPNMLQQLGLCFSTTAILEGVFSLQGIGMAIIVSINQRDSTMLHGQLLVLALAIAIANKGKCLALIGESGSGKSTVGRILIGLEHADSGSLSMDGEDMLCWDRRQWHDHRANLQAVFQDASGTLNPRMSVSRNIQIAMKNLTRLNRRERDKRIGEMMAMTKMPPRLLKTPTSALSGGEQRRIALLRALSIYPDYIVLDEVTSGLDSINAERVADVLAIALREYACGCLLISHDMRVVDRLADEVIELSHGKVINRAKRKGWRFHIAVRIFFPPSKIRWHSSWILKGWVIVMTAKVCDDYNRWRRHTVAF